jgi:serine/threonine kinase 38
LQAHPWFDGVEWDKLYQMEAAFIPEVKDDLDTQNFENFEEVLTSLNFFIGFVNHLCLLLTLLLFFLLALLCSLRTKLKLHLKLVHGERSV